MNKYLIKIGLFFAFCIISVAIIACSDEFIASNLDEEIRINEDLGIVSDLSVKEGFRDSTIMRMIATLNPEEGLDISIDGAEVAVENSMKRILRFQVEWNIPSNVVDFEVRVNQKPVTQKNWHLSQFAQIEKDASSTSDKFIGSILVAPTPKILTARCTSCGDCKEKCPVDAISLESGKPIIDYDKCIECGECYRACKYDAVGGVFAGTTYYFGIRSINEDGEYSKEVYCSDESYKLRYVTISEVPDEYEGKVFKGCAGNCQFQGCFIPNPTSEFCKPFDGDFTKRIGDEIDTTLPSVCPVDAIYEEGMVGNDSNLVPIYIDKDKCINCGRCVGQCYVNGGWGAVTTEVIKVFSRLF